MMMDSDDDEKNKQIGYDLRTQTKVFMIKLRILKQQNIKILTS